MNPKAPGKIQRAAAWGESAFKEVYSRYIKPLRAYIFRRVRNYHDAEDLTAQVFYQALGHLDPKVTRPELEAWLFTSARNATANHARARKFRASISIEEIEEPAQTQEAEPGSALEEEENVARLAEAIRRLPEEQRRALMLRFFEGMSHSEIAELLGRSEGSARVLIHRTLSDLREEVS